MARPLSDKELATTQELLHIQQTKKRTLTFAERNILNIAKKRERRQSPKSWKFNKLLAFVHYCRRTHST